MSEKYNPETTPGRKVLKDDVSKPLGGLAVTGKRKDDAAKKLGGLAMNDKNKK